MCATMNADLTQYYSAIEKQKKDVHSTSIIDNFIATFLYSASREWYTRNGRLPDLVLIYRDGVGEGMLQGVVNHEIPQFHHVVDKINEEKGGWKPTLSFIVVTKRVTTRLFAPSRDGFSNPNPGTVVDSDCTHRGWYDFFLVSQSVFQGTVTPTRYHVLFDDTGLTPEQIQLLTYKMCHLYVNWCGTVRVPAACQYAHKLAFLTSQSLHNKPSQQLAHQLHFL